MKTIIKSVAIVGLALCAPTLASAGQVYSCRSSSDASAKPLFQIEEDASSKLVTIRAQYRLDSRGSPSTLSVADLSFHSATGADLYEGDTSKGDGVVTKKSWVRYTVLFNGNGRGARASGPSAIQLTVYDPNFLSAWDPMTCTSNP
jgi:hypothetical protein